MKVKSHSGIRLRTLKSQQIINRESPHNAQIIDETNLKPVTFQRKPQPTKRIFQKQIIPKILNSKRRMSASAKIISYPTNHFESWIAPTYLKQTNSNFANKIISKLVNIYQPKHTYTQQNQVKNKKSFSNSKFQRFTTQPIQQIYENKLKIPTKTKNYIQIKKMTKISLQYKGQQIENLKPQFRKSKIFNQR